MRVKIKSNEYTEQCLAVSEEMWKYIIITHKYTAL